jgi:hypothetical protein
MTNLYLLGDEREKKKKPIKNNLSSLPFTHAASRKRGCSSASNNMVKGHVAHPKTVHTLVCVKACAISFLN